MRNEPDVTTDRMMICLCGTWKLMIKGGLDREGNDYCDSVELPGTLDENKIGVVNTEVSLQGLHRTYSYEGPAVYERTVTIPIDWSDKKITLFLERTRVTRVWIDGSFAGIRSELTTPQQYDLTDWLNPGVHTLTIEVDNASDVMGWGSVRNSHMASESTQTNWHGIVGRLELQATAPIYIDDVQIYPDVSENVVQAMVSVGIAEGTQVCGSASLEILGNDGEVLTDPVSVSWEQSLGSSASSFKADIELGGNVRRWDEFDPALYTLRVRLNTEFNGQKMLDQRDFIFGMRTFGVKGTQFCINGKTIFLRGKHDACVFPLTGYAPMYKEAWLRLFRIAKAYGINHYRFHSWCPPEVAFAAADEVGIYMQPELSMWNPRSAFENEKEWSYYKREAETILRTYGNHPSFVMFAWGNELSGSIKRMEELVEQCQSIDSRRLYTIGSNNFFSQALKPNKSDYWTTFWTEGRWNLKKCGYGGKHVRGSTPHSTRGHINNDPPSTMTDYRESIEGIQIPVIGHEVGQYQVHPDFHEIAKYRGVLEPLNLEEFRSSLHVAGMLDQVESFRQASGELAVLCYREEIETALRTPGFGGFQLLDLQDFPGQGTALVGILDAFMDSKGLVEPEEWRQFCCETVPLLRMKKYTWTTDEMFYGDVEIVNYGPKDLQRGVLWNIVDGDGHTIAEGCWPGERITQGRLNGIGRIKIPLKIAASPARYSVTVWIEGTHYSNVYSIWVYPERVSVQIPESIHVVRELDEDSLALLTSGEKVLVMPHLDKLANSVAGAFIPDFWCYSMFKKYAPPGTLGIRCNSKHPALRMFPTGHRSDWQWWHLLKRSRPLIMDQMSRGIGTPIVQGIDNVIRQHKLGIIVEAQVGSGKLLICAIDLLDQLDRPEARQLFSSLLSYMQSREFAPVDEWSPDEAASLLGDTLFGDDTVQANKDADKFG